MFVMINLSDLVGWISALILLTQVSIGHATDSRSEANLSANSDACSKDLEGFHQFWLSRNQL